MAKILEGEVVAETLNLQIVRRPEGNDPRMVVLHLQSDQLMSLLDAVMGYRRWNNLILNDVDRAALDESKKHIAKDILREKRKQKTCQGPSQLIATRITCLTQVLEGEQSIDNNHID